ncbi:hypothetical protein [Mesorhizobium sp. A623]
MGNLDNPEVDGSFNGLGEHLFAAGDVVSALTSCALSAAHRF